MIRLRALPLLFVPLIAGCQGLLTQSPPPPPTERLQGMLTEQAGQLYFTPCTGSRALQLRASEQLGLQEDVDALSEGRPLFADLRGELSTGPERFLATQVYRLQAEGFGCADPGFRQLIVRASGHEPDWTVTLNAQGLLLERPDQARLALPYLEEQLPGGQASFTSEADGQRLELWIAPQRCVDSASGTISHLSAQLRLNDAKPLRGCAYFGAARNH